jgi:DNA-binding NarL/FixJ family response regulator
LTARERAVFDLLMQCKSTDKIAEELNIASCTVRTHKQHIYQKLGVAGNELNMFLARYRARSLWRRKEGEKAV